MALDSHCLPLNLAAGAYLDLPAIRQVEADEAHAKIAEALEKAVEVGQLGRVAKESAEVTQGPSLWR
jgi:hypothetical protein